MDITLQFSGAAGMVTGSCYLLTTPKKKVLIDCGMFQGAKTLRELNYQRFTFDPRSIDVVLLTHAHIDHSGLLPKLYAHGFRKFIHATQGTAQLLNWMLPDSANIQETEVARFNRRNQRRRREQVAPIYTRQDADNTLEHLRVETYGAWFSPTPGMRARYWNAGHILGSASIEVEVGDAEKSPLRLLFSGDVGPNNKPLQRDAEAPSDFDYLIVESTYGGRHRLHLSEEERRQALKKEVMAALARGGNLIVPSFAVERTQEFLFDLLELMASGDLPSAPVFLDSPLAIRATEVFERNMRAPERAAHARANPFRASNVRFVQDAHESSQISQIKGGAIILAASGMCEAGRIRSHLKNNLWNDRATVLLIGYQAPGTMGALLANGVKAVRIHGEEVAVNAEIRLIDLYSGHADHGELLDWIRHRLPVKRGIFLTHGEVEARAALAKEISLFDAPVKVIEPSLDEIFALSGDSDPVLRPQSTPPRLTQAAIKSGVAAWDWHNDYAQLVLQLQHQLRTAPTDTERNQLLQHVKQALKKT